MNEVKVEEKDFLEYGVEVIKDTGNPEDLLRFDEETRTIYLSEVIFEEIIEASKEDNIPIEDALSVFINKMLLQAIESYKKEEKAENQDSDQQ